jgi:hypothetical protein
MQAIFLGQANQLLEQAILPLVGDDILSGVCAV